MTLAPLVIVNPKLTNVEQALSELDLDVPLLFKEILRPQQRRLTPLFKQKAVELDKGIPKEHLVAKGNILRPYPSMLLQAPEFASVLRPKDSLRKIEFDGTPVRSFNRVLHRLGTLTLQLPFERNLHTFPTSTLKPELHCAEHVESQPFFISQQP